MQMTSKLITKYAKLIAHPLQISNIFSDEFQ